MNEVRERKESNKDTFMENLVVVAHRPCIFFIWRAREGT